MTYSTDSDTTEVGSPSTPPSEVEELSSTGARPSIARPAIATMSLGKPGLHPLDKKLQAVASKGFQGVELFWPDLQAYAESVTATITASSTGTPAKPLPPIVVAACEIRGLCDKLGLDVLSLQPFVNYDSINCPELLASRIREFGTWLTVAQTLQAKCIGVPSTIVGSDKTHTSDPTVIARNIRELAQLAQPYGITIAYENLCFGANLQSWTQAWDVVSRAGADNIAFLPDTFNLCGDVFGDPSAEDGIAPDGHAALAASLDKLLRTVPLSSMPLLQVADAELMDPPLTSDHPWMEGCQNAKMAWSRNARLFPFEGAGYLPVRALVGAFVAAGWAGWVSMEVFSRTTATPGDETILQHAERAWKSWGALAKEMRWEVRPVVKGG